MTTQNSTNNVYKGSGNGCTAYVNYSPPSASVNAQLNVSSVDILAVGRYRLNFTSAYANANYYVSMNVSRDPGGVGQVDSAAATPTTTAVRITSAYTSFVTPNFFTATIIPT